MNLYIGESKKIKKIKALFSLDKNAYFGFKIYPPFCLEPVICENTQSFTKSDKP